MSNGSDKTAAALEREINHDRQRIEDKLNAIQGKLTPGQLIDEALVYVKARGATEYFSNLGQAAKTNPLPLALMGIGLAWLVASPTARSQQPYDSSSSEDDYPLATVMGSLRRTRPSYVEDGRSYSDFADDAGKRFKALTDESGRRAGHFADETGRYFRGFADSTGRTIDAVRDETGAMLDEPPAGLRTLGALPRNRFATWLRVPQIAPTSCATPLRMRSAPSSSNPVA